MAKASKKPLGITDVVLRDATVTIIEGCNA